jgi:hemerythrin-like domain-containing protein
MKRSEALSPLSRDHHHGLFAALQLRRASAADAEDARRAFLAFWHSEGAHHFRVEEEVLLPTLARHASADDDAIVRTLVEHVDLRRRAADLEGSAGPPLEALHELGDRLHAHIRGEENQLFPLIEATLSSAELDELGTAIERAEAR